MRVIDFKYRRLNSLWISVSYFPLIGRALVCHRGLSRYLYLPNTNRIDTLYCVFTKGKNENSFKLCPDNGVEGPVLHSCAEELCVYLYYKGYRYVHVEYMEKV